MPSSYTQILLHFVFGTKHRTPWITDEHAPRLHAFMGGIVRDEAGTALCINGMPDHVHLLVRWKTDDSISNLMRNVKARSSRWMHENNPATRGFAWQEGYGCFSVSQSQKNSVVAYIKRQREHHAAMDYRSEYFRLLRAHDVQFDERYVLADE